MVRGIYACGLELGKRMARRARGELGMAHLARDGGRGWGPERRSSRSIEGCKFCVSYRRERRTRGRVTSLSSWLLFRPASFLAPLHELLDLCRAMLSA
jgi:hypothetical protein